FSLSNVATVEDESIESNLVFKVDGVKLKELVRAILAEELDFHLLGIRTFFTLAKFLLEVIDDRRWYEFKEVLADEFSPVSESFSDRCIVIMDVPFKVYDKN